MHAPAAPEARAAAISVMAIAMSTPFSGCRGRVRFSSERNASQPALSTARSLSWVV